MGTWGGDLIREARRRAGITQAELAARAGTSQPGIARWESGRTAVSLSDVFRIVRACGFDLETQLVPRDTDDIYQADRLADLTPEERVDRHQRVIDQFYELRRARHGG